MKQKKELIILAVIILALVLYLVLRKQDRIHYQLPEIQKIAQSDISKIEIVRPRDSIVIEKTADHWVVGPEKYLADSSGVKKMLQVIEQPVITAMVSGSKSYTRYGLGKDNRIMVRAFSGKVEKREIELGNATVPGRHTFVKLPDDYRVYHARNDLRSIFGKKLDELRDKNILSFDQKDIKEIHVIKGLQSVALALKQVPAEKTNGKKEDAETTDSQKTEDLWHTSKGEKVDKDILDTLLTGLSKLSCKEYLYGIKKGDLTNPMCRVILKGSKEKEYSLSIFPKKDEKDYSYPAISSENDYPFNLSSWSAEKIMNAPDKILKEPGKSEGS